MNDLSDFTQLFFYIAFAAIIFCLGMLIGNLLNNGAKKKSKALALENTSFKTQIDQLNEKLAVSERNSSEGKLLSRELEMAKEEYDALTNKYGQVIAAYNELKNKPAIVSNDGANYEKLQSEYALLSQENDQLKFSLNSYATSSNTNVEDTSAYISELELENARLRGRVNNYETLDVSSSSSNVNHLALIATLENENARLRGRVNNYETLTLNTLQLSTPIKQNQVIESNNTFASADNDPEIAVEFHLTKEEMGNAFEAVIVGTFNDWDSDKGIPMIKNADGSVSKILKLSKGQTHEYRYLLDGNRWVNDKRADDYKYVESLKIKNCVIEL